METNTDWILTEILNGLQQLMCLGFERQPAGELIPGTARAWMQAICTGRHWDQQRDTPRFRRAFITLSQSRRNWPLPMDFVEAMPSPESQASLPPRVATPEQAKAHLERISDLLRQSPPTADSGLGQAAQELMANASGGRR